MKLTVSLPIHAWVVVKGLMERQVAWKRAHKCPSSHPVQICDSHHTYSLMNFNSHSSRWMTTHIDWEETFTARSGRAEKVRGLFLSPFNDMQKRGGKQPTQYQTSLVPRPSNAPLPLPLNYRNMEMKNTRYQTRLCAAKPRHGDAIFTLHVNLSTSPCATLSAWAAAEQDETLMSTSDH